MFKGQTATQVIVDEFKLPKTMIHRQIYGKKYPGGGQKLEKLQEIDSRTSAKASGSGAKRVAAVILKKTKVTEEAAKQNVEMSEDKKGKGTGKSSKKTRTVADIRDQSTADKEKQK